MSKIRDKVSWWLQAGQYEWMDWNHDWLYKKLPTRVSDVIVAAQERFIEYPVAKVICKFSGHLPIVDHCGMPAHDYCMGCGERLPGQAARDPR